MTIIRVRQVHADGSDERAPSRQLSDRCATYLANHIRLTDLVCQREAGVFAVYFSLKENGDLNTLLDRLLPLMSGLGAAEGGREAGIRIDTTHAFYQAGESADRWLERALRPPT
ncbi:hypothetical protein [Niveibacterium sp.]|uniref:hypothetical protein n=1 Tax=Niveibacterium sp. TaxID=2017444 RepID=UPI0035AF8DF5